MKTPLLALAILGFIPGVAVADVGFGNLPPPPSIALNATPRPAGSEIRFLVDVIPASAKFVVYGQMSLNGLTVDESRAAEIGAGISGAIERTTDYAREKGANLIVLLSQQHGVSVPIRQAGQPLVLRRHNPVVTLVYFTWDAAGGLSEGEKRIRFFAGEPFPPAAPAPPAGGPRQATQIHCTISLEVNTARVSKSYWTYSNISRFVEIAVANGFDTIALKSPGGLVSEDVWLPSCDAPVRISRARPELDVTIFKRKQP